jgi:hydroxymethylpyrimidine pyrophosphatase-like HAD family hydrolase
MRCLYVDLDGTLLGRDASLLHDAEGAFSLLGARALEACHRAGVEVVPYSGRRRLTLFHDARLMGLPSYIFEAGAGLVLDGELRYLTGELQPGERTIHEQIGDSGAPALLLDHYAGRLEYHEPWHLDREVSHLFRGRVDALEADQLLRERGLGHVRLVDNGSIHRRSPTLPEVAEPHAYHLVPRAASKAGAVAAHMRARGYAPADCVAVGDSREDMGAAGVVGTFWLVRNALERDPTLSEAIARHPNVRVCEERHGAGVYEAVVTTLAARRAA